LGLPKRKIDWRREGERGFRIGGETRRSYDGIQREILELGAKAAAFDIVS
jgi:hypothetical protein